MAYQQNREINGTFQKHLNLVPRAISGLGLTNDPGTGCKMGKILAHFPAWYHGKVAPGYHGMYGSLWLPPLSALLRRVRIRSCDVHGAKLLPAY